MDGAQFCSLGAAESRTAAEERAGRCLAGNTGVKGPDRRLMLLAQMALSLCGSKYAMSSKTDIYFIKHSWLM